MVSTLVEQLETQLVAIDDLHPSSENPRKIEAKRLEQLARSLESDPLMLQARPIVALRDGEIVAGNMRWLAARKLGWIEIPTVFVDLDREQARVWMLRDNQSYGDWVDSSLAVLLATLSDSDVDLDLIGFDEDELRRLVGDDERDVTPQLPSMTYSVLVDCESEQTQIELAARLEAEGLNVKLLMA